MVSRRDFISLAASATAYLLASDSLAEITEHSSPVSNKRAFVRSFDNIILHTTECSEKSALISLTEHGRANYLVGKKGQIYEILPPGQISVGAGRSIWNGIPNLDEYSINIEVSGFHTEQPTPRQYDALRELLSMRQRYGIPDQRIMTHSQVAYGAPIMKLPRSFRGRKRCGMFFATPRIREKLGLTTGAQSDPDVESGRLVVGDPELAKVLYGKAPPAHEREKPPVKVRGFWNKRVYAGMEYDYPTTTYFFKDRVVSGKELSKEGFDFKKVKPDTKIAVGFEYAGLAEKECEAQELMGAIWNYPSVEYVFPDRLITGEDLKAKLQKGTHIIVRV